ncbi:unnamed protein product [Blepharisma stoltei]|uniref:Uncharacterized protein n=1 Tax=Blepharisma stoltei TaxID=1481888 RepID=A0AAU9KE07_9CILI|nr:unnamed protein product [Blepharisma stoltei]
MERRAAQDRSKSVDKASEILSRNQEGVLKDKSNNKALFEMPSDFNIDKHLNSRLFKRFLEEESRLQKSKQKVVVEKETKQTQIKKEVQPPQPPPQLKNESPLRERKIPQFSQPSPDSPQSSQYQSMDSGEIKGYSQHIPAYIPQVDISRQNSFAHYPQFQFPSQQFMPPPASYFPSMYPQIFPQMQYSEMILRQQTEALQSQLQFLHQNDIKSKEEFEREKKELQDIISIKDNEIIKLKKALENAKYDIMDLEDQVRNGGNYNGEDFNNLQKRCAYLEEQLQKGNKNSDGYKERYEQSEMELKNANLSIEELERQLNKAREKIEELENRVNSNKNTSNAEKDLARAEDRIEMLEAELESSKKKCSQQIKQLTLENDQLKLQINQLKKAPSREDIDENPRYYEREEEERPIRAEEPRRNQNQNRESHSPLIRNMSRTNNSACVENALNWETPPRQFIKKEPKKPDVSPIPGPKNDNIDVMANMESKLNMLLVDKQRLENEYNRIANNAQNKRRKDELELEIDILNTNIGNLKNKLRSFR